jgi:hypothetical protein
MPWWSGSSSQEGCCVKSCRTATRFRRRGAPWEHASSVAGTSGVWLQRASRLTLDARGVRCGRVYPEAIPCPPLCQASTVACQEPASARCCVMCSVWPRCLPVQRLGQLARLPWQRGQGCPPGGCTSNTRIRTILRTRRAPALSPGLMIRAMPSLSPKNWSSRLNATIT